MSFALIALGLTMGCGTPVDPLADERAGLAGLDHVPMPPGWAPSATIILSDAQIQKLVTRFSAQANAKVPQFTVEKPVKITATLKPDPPLVTLGTSDQCPECVGLAGSGTGSLVLDAAGLGGSVRWRSNVAAIAKVEGTPKPSGFEVSLVPVKRESWTVGLDVQGLPPIYGTVIEAALAHQIEVGIKEAGPLSAPITLATVPYDGLVRMRGLRTRYAGALDVDLGFSTLRSGVVKDQPDPGAGFAVVLPADTLLGIAQAAMIRSGPIQGYEPEPTALHLDDGKFELWMKIWKVAPREKWREYVVRGAFGLQDGVLSVKAEDAIETSKQKWGTALDPIIQAVVVDTLKKTIAVQTPGQYVHPLGDVGDLKVTIIRVAAEDDVLTAWGTIE